MEIMDWLQASGLIGFYIAAFILGAFHALEPGHGKTVVAAYLVGSKGRIYEAVLLGVVVTLTHTFSIIVLAVVARYAAASYTDQQLHTYLGFVAAILILAVGVAMMYARWRALPGHGHHHGHAHGHEGEERGHAHHDEHHGHGHTHPHGLFSHSHGPAPGERLSMWKLFALGVSGGLVPCPAAFALLLAAASAGALAKGVGLVLVFSVGLAAALVAIGIGVVKAAGLAGRFMDTERYAPYVAMASAVLVTLIGVFALYTSVKHVM
ncbi:MAG TPA: sulfite exporter TauE/SafE family protein [Nitrospirota bacterium]|nr:sulfite exporter TauE/SafE family protein [Nitrospirota bacterium]